LQWRFIRAVQFATGDSVDFSQLCFIVAKQTIGKSQFFPPQTSRSRFGIFDALVVLTL
jgi:hypothetical protein